MDNANYIAAFNGYDRQGQFALDKTSVFKSYAEAESYVRDGQLQRSSAYPGQRISVVDSASNKTSVFTVSPDYKLVGLTSTISVDAATYMEFNYQAFSGSMSGKSKIALAEGSFLKSITVQILEPFNTDCFTVGSDEVNGIDDPTKKFLSEEEMLVDEVGDYIVYFNTVITKPTNVVLYDVAGKPATKGRAIIKIN